MLLSTNAKLEKLPEQVSDYSPVLLTLAPHSMSGTNVCPASSPGCRNSCNMWFSGQRVMPQSRAAAIRNTLWLTGHRSSFLEQLHTDITVHAIRCERDNKTPLVRLNGASDLDWLEVIESHPDVVFYDYSKVASRFKQYLAGKLPENYFLTFSAHERHKPDMLAGFLRDGGNVAQVFDVPYHPQSGKYGALPHHVTLAGHRAPVIDGDLHDIRLPQVDGTGVVVGLRLKGTRAAKASAIHSGFAI